MKKEANEYAHNCQKKETNPSIYVLEYSNLVKENVKGK